MDETNRPVGNPPQQAHRSQTIWQIYLPLIVAGLLAAAAFYILLRSTQSGPDALRVWADIAMVWIILLLFLLIFFLLAFFLLGSFCIIKFSRFAHQNLTRLNHTVSRISGRVVAALGRIQKGMIEAETFTSALSHKPKE